ncbi:MAG: hydroxyacylglutathione hydrolase [Rhodanobacteraceae bacterium]
MQLVPIPALRDNYIWLFGDDQGKALVVDPGEADPVQHEIARRGITLTHILLTHHHADHIGASMELAQACGARIVAPHDKRIAHADQRVDDGDIIVLQQPECRFRVIAVPGHTLSHVAFFGEGILFCGDTLFSLGCGRLFEGTPEQMLTSLDRLSALPAETRVCCGHEYTLDNAAFAQSVEPENPALADRIRQAKGQRRQGQATLPSSLASERNANPFLRVDSPQLKAWAKGNQIADDRIQRFAALREAKDRFKS